jgi:SMC interacting uncharacterized protein involved in chromosome segregation
MESLRHDDDPIEYTTPARVQAWFLRRSRELWKKKYMQLKSDAKRLQNRVNDVTKSRESWCEETKQLTQQLREVVAENAALRAQVEASKKKRKRRSP